jgi:hypothetical protein
MTSSPGRVLLALAADALVLGAFLYVALGAGAGSGQEGLEGLVRGQELTEALDARSTASTFAAVPRVPTSGTAKVEIEDMLSTTPVDVGVAVVDAEGGLILGANERTPFVLASVAKVYILAAFLDEIHREGRSMNDSDVLLMDAMIRYSDNDSATSLWDYVGGEEGIVSFLESRGLAAVRPSEEDAWGTLYASASQVSELLRRLIVGELLDPASTEIAVELLSDIDADQAWGVSAGAGEPGAGVLLKNGWYPDLDGWRVNSAGAVRSADGSDFVVAILSYRADNLNEGIALVEAIAVRINAFIRE